MLIKRIVERHPPEAIYVRERRTGDKDTYLKLSYNGRSGYMYPTAPGFSTTKEGTLLDSVIETKLFQGLINLPKLLGNR